MIFCGQCGLQLAPGSTRCPRCGAVVDATSSTANAPYEDIHTDDATVASPAFQLQNPPGRPGNPPQPLILRSGTDNTNTYGNQEATSRVEMSQNFGPSQTAYPGYAQSGGAYPPQNAYPEYGVGAGGNYPQQQGMSYPGIAPGYGQHPGQYQQPSAVNNTHHKGRVAAMSIILIGLLLVLGAVILFTLQQTGKLASTGPQNLLTQTRLVDTVQSSTTIQAQQAEIPGNRYYPYIHNSHTKQSPDTSSVQGVIVLATEAMH
ncbi:zinc ribbon domain-containing protein [Tengunoibacter tsumagoiensis]|uniref:Zinc-ribbon domain-containing protein n=1 Tax=Tengunoibacter tsumagoiensis TaxID=2014871 RepID=A0A401ZYS5_9CHLR|nr:zinc ribbon domain-containing protein [Tengunoibacter tsumagoiensis]GCE11995.1 hypothetical protein KTT_18540 [Tengunoibacter tsumagoiensis]